MQSLEALRARRQSYQGIFQILSSMKVITAIRWQKVRQDYQEATVYSEGIRQRLETLLVEPLPPPAGPLGLILMSSDEGLVGSFNEPLFAMLRQRGKERPLRVAAMGRKGKAFLTREGIPALSLEIPPFPRYPELLATCEALVDSAARGEIGGVEVLFNCFESFSRHTPVFRRIFPPDVQPKGRENGLGSSPPSLLRYLFLESLASELFMAARQSMASEQSARLATVSGAEERMKRALELLTQQLHQASQARITEDLIAMTSQ